VYRAGLAMHDRPAGLRLNQPQFRTVKSASSSSQLPWAPGSNELGCRFRVRAPVRYALTRLAGLGVCKDGATFQRHRACREWTVSMISAWTGVCAVCCARYMAMSVTPSAISTAWARRS
jgi:hypothetical protein